MIKNQELYCRSALLVHYLCVCQNISAKECSDRICQCAGRRKNMKLTFGEKSFIALPVHSGTFAASSVMHKKGQNTFYRSLGAQNCITGWYYARL